MPASTRIVSEVNSILGGTGAVTLAEALVALGAATGIVAFTKKIGLWSRLTPVERRELELEDEAKPEGWWTSVKTLLPAALMTGKRFAWRHGNWAVDTNTGTITTPKLDEETGTLK